MNLDKIIKDISLNLQKQPVLKIILFGSVAYKESNDDSDIDIIVVTPDNFIPETNHDRMQLHHKYNELIKNYKKITPIDLLVYTKKMFNQLQESNNLFSREINSKGKILYEKK